MGISASETSIVGKKLRSIYPVDEKLPSDVTSLLAKLDDHQPNEVSVNIQEETLNKRRSWWPFSRQP